MSSKSVPVYSIKGEKVGQLTLPPQFDEEYRPDLIAKAVISAQSARRQPYGSDLMAGQRSSAQFIGRRRKYGHSYGWGISRIPRLMVRGGRRVGPARIAPHAVTGRRAHPPKAYKNYLESINVKERRKAIRSAISATSKKELVVARGHRVNNIEEFPLIIEDKFQEFTKTKEVIALFEKLGLNHELERGQIKKVRAGKGKSRGRPYKKKRSILVVFGEDKGIRKCASGIPGVDATHVKKLNAEVLAPGTHPGRITVWTKKAIEILEKENWFR